LLKAYYACALFSETLGCRPTRRSGTNYQHINFLRILAHLLLDLLLKHRDKLRRLSPDTEAARRVQNLVEERGKLVDEKTEQINRLTSRLKIYFPQMLDWFDRLDREAACALLERWPTLQELQKVPPAKLRTFFRKHHCRDQEVIERRIVGIRQTIPAIRDRAVIEAKSAVVKVIAQLIRILVQGIAELDRKLEEEAAAHPEFFIFDSLTHCRERARCWRRVCWRRLAHSERVMVAHRKSRPTVGSRR
jgi:hypothetical protein